MIVREIAEADYAAWKVLWDGYNAFYGRAGPTALPAATTEITWSRFFDPAEPVYGLVAEADGQVAGFVHYLLHRSTSQPVDVCYLQDLFTDPTFRGRGLGRALIEAVYGRARAFGCRRVYWQTHETNAVARRLYDTIAERSGFIVYRKDL